MTQSTTRFYIFIAYGTSFSFTVTKYYLTAIAKQKNYKLLVSREDQNSSLFYLFGFVLGIFRYRNICSIMKLRKWLKDGRFFCQKCIFLNCV